MTGDYRVKALANEEIRAFAKKAREFFGVTDVDYVDVLSCLKRPTIWTARGLRVLNFQVRPDSEFADDYGSTSYGKGIVTIAIRQSVYDEAFVGVGRARNTVAHEVGHAVMHEGPKMSRRIDGNITPKWIQPFESAEHQAKVFAPAFLINDVIARALANAEEISVRFSISLESGKIYFEQLMERRNRQESAERVRQMAEEFRARTAPVQPKVQYLQALCSNCGNATIFPIGIKFMCDTCKTVSDRFPDGDAGE